MPKKMLGLPKTLLVVKRVEKVDGAFYMADDDGDLFDDGEVVGTYELKKLGKKVVTYTIG